MPPPRISPSFARAFRYNQSTPRCPPRHGAAFKRSCSCSAPKLSHDPVKTSGAPQLNPTTAHPPTPPLDHRTLAQAQELFVTSLYSPGSPLLLPNGAYIFQKLQAFLRAQYPDFGFQEVITPTIYKKSLWEASGHWDNYAEDMFSVQGRGATGKTENAQAGEDEEFGLKPMNCPGHCLLFGTSLRSYRDLPIRYADFSALHRNEISGALTGLTRVRRFHQDDAHIFCRPDQILEEIEQTLRFVGLVYDTFGLGPYKLLLSTRPKDSFIGSVDEWDRAEEQLTTALNNSGREWALNEGDGAFYGPKIDIVLRDSNGKEHQTATIQLDFQLPQRFDLKYQPSREELASTPLSETPADVPNPDAEAHEQEPGQAFRRPVIIHRAIYGSLERFMALLIEHYAGIYPFWLSPRPAIILSLNQDQAVLDHVEEIREELSSGVSTSRQNGSQSPHSESFTSESFLCSSPLEGRPRWLSTLHLPVATDTSARPLSQKIAEAKAKKYNHIIVVGPKDVADNAMTLQVAQRQEESWGVLGLVTKLKSSKEWLELGKKTNRISVGKKDARQYFVELTRRYL